jgi:hypothetical protein
VSHWMTTLQGDAAMVMRNGSFWALVGKDGGAEIVSNRKKSDRWDLLQINNLLNGQMRLIYRRHNYLQVKPYGSPCPVSSSKIEVCEHEELIMALMSISVYN